MPLSSEAFNSKIDSWYSFFGYIAFAIQCIVEVFPTPDLPVNIILGISLFSIILFILLYNLFANYYYTQDIIFYSLLLY